MNEPMLLPLDHVIAVVSDLYAAREAWIAAGFVASPVSRHDSGLGTANSCIMFDGSYVELITVVEDTPANARWRTLGADGPSLRGVALRSAAIEDCAAELAPLGIATEPLRRFARRIGDDELRFSVVRIVGSQTPSLQCLYCQHHTPQLLWTEGSLRHPNGARRIVAARVPGAEALRPLADPTLSGVPVTDGPGRLRIAGVGDIGAGAREALERYSGLEIEVIAA